MKAKFYFLLFFVCTFSFLFAQDGYEKKYYYPSLGSSSWTIPCGVTQIKVEVIGGGGCGGRNSSDDRRASGGGGGAYSQRIIDVVAGEIFYTYVGAGGISNSNTRNGGDSWFNNVNSKPTADSEYAILAKGGTGADSNGNEPHVNGGQAGEGYGSIKFNGGNGGKGYGGFFGTSYGGGGAGHESGPGNGGGHPAGGTSADPGGDGGSAPSVKLSVL